MTNAYVWVAWNRHKRVYDAVLAGVVALFVIAFAGLTMALADHPPDPAVAIMRALGACAFALLHVVLAIGPLARLTDRGAPLLYNRRHLGVTLFLVALAHASVAVLYYGAFGAGPDPLTQVLFEGRDFASLAAFPFELLGFAALLWLFLMAATSHDYWLHTLSPHVWKALHMGVYAVYALLVGHVALGSMRDDPSWLTPALLLGGAALLGALHVIAGVRELTRDAAGLRAQPETHPWVRVCKATDVRESHAKPVCLASGERIAIVRHKGALTALSGVCAHQHGPLGEGRVIDGCLTCPWHGYQYLPHNGQSPPPYTEKIPTYRLRIEGDDVLIDPTPLPPGTPVDPVVVPAAPEDTTLFEDVHKDPSLAPTDVLDDLTRRTEP